MIETISEPSDHWHLAIIWGFAAHSYCNPAVEVRHLCNGERICRSITAKRFFNEKLEFFFLYFFEKVYLRSILDSIFNFKKYDLKIII
jgi:hypothetical protein